MAGEGNTYNVDATISRNSNDGLESTEINTYEDQEDHGQLTRLLVFFLSGRSWLASVGAGRQVVG